MSVQGAPDAEELRRRWLQARLAVEPEAGLRQAIQRQLQAR